MNFAMWAQALTRMPRTSKAEWDGLDYFSRWLIATRSAVLILTFISCAMSGLLAWRDGVFDLQLWGLMSLGLLLAHATNNLLNDLVDFTKGVDEGDYYRNRYGTQPLAQGYMNLKEFAVYVVLTGGAAIAIGVFLMMRGGPEVMWLFGAGVFFVIFYTWPLKYLGMGEPTVLLVWGPLMVGGGYLVMSGEWNWEVTIASLAYGFGVTGVLFGKHIDKLPSDEQKGVRTLPVMLGDRVARYGAITLLALQYLSVVSLVFTGYFSPILLMVFFAVPTFVKVARGFRAPAPEHPPDEFPEEVWPLWFAALSFWHNRTFGVLFLLSLVIECSLTASGVAIPRVGF